jgi:Haem-degrading
MTLADLAAFPTRGRGYRKFTMTAPPDPTDVELAAQEASLVFDRFNNNDGIALGLALVDAARGANLAVTVDVRRGDQQVFHVGLPGTTADNDAWVERKVRTVRRFAPCLRPLCLMRLRLPPMVARFRSPSLVLGSSELLRCQGFLNGRIMR